MRLWLGIAIAALLAVWISLASAAEWCGFIDKANQPVHCGYSTLAECKQALGDKKDVVCMPSPSFAARYLRSRSG